MCPPPGPVHADVAPIAASGPPADLLKGAATMPSHVLYRTGRFAARRPWTVIGAWLVVSVLVIAASGAFGRDLEDSFEVPGLDSQNAADLLSAAGSNQAGLTAQVVLTPLDERATFFDSPDARAALAQVQATVADLPKVAGTTDPAAALAAGPEAAVRSGAISPDGRVALLRVQYPKLEDLDPTDLENLKTAGARASEGSPLRIEMGGDLFFALEEAPTGGGVPRAHGGTLGTLAAHIPSSASKNKNNATSESE